MPKRVPLPPPLDTRPFLYREGRDARLGAGRLRGDDLETPYRGVRTLAGQPVADVTLLLARCAAYAPLMEHGRFFSHVTAARLWEAPLARDFTPEDLLHVSAVAPLVAPRMKGIAGHQSNDSDMCVIPRHGFDTSDPESTWLSLGALLGLDELVVVGDHLVLSPAVLNPLDIRPFTTVERLSDRLSAFHGRGARSLARALRLVRGGAESRPETLLRLLLVRSGMPEPELNIPVTGLGERELGRGDLVYPRWRAVVEYDGDQHRTSTRQYDRDIHRLDSFRDAGWRVVQVRSRGLFVTPSQTVARVAKALRASGWSG